MKNILKLLLAFVICCNTNNDLSENDILVDRTTPENKDEIAISDTLLLFPEISDTLRFTKEKFNEIIGKHSEFFEEFPKHPDHNYNCHEDYENFGSELGQDVYYLMYSYFLKHRENNMNYSIERRKLITTYHSINHLFSNFQYGGTFFGHQYPRILGYVEYDLYKLNYSQVIKKAYNYKKQKMIYIQSLRQLIEDEIGIDVYLLENSELKTNRKNELNNIVDEIDENITDLFILRKCQAFHHKYYQYI